MAFEDLDMTPVVDKMDPTFGRNIDCESGWHGLIIELHERLNAIDPDYRIYQIKEKFGGLRFYFACSSPLFHSEMSKLTETYERISFLTCEKTGKPGELMWRAGCYKTLHVGFINDGWEPVENPFS